MDSRVRCVVDREGLKREVRSYWDRTPCGTGEVSQPRGSKEFFETVEEHRYKAEPFIHEFAQFTRFHRRRVLEVGCGIGTDLLQFARAGAEICGIDISIESLKLTQTRLGLYGLRPMLVNGDAENLPFPSNYFDLVYSWGVLHHTPDMKKAIDEVYRVLKPVGIIRIMLYHRYSWVVLQRYVRFGLLRGRPFASAADILASHQESPGTQAFTVAEARNLFARFSDIEIRTTLTPYDYHRLPQLVVKHSSDRFGWFLLVSGMKR